MTKLFPEISMLIFFYWLYLSEPIFFTLVGNVKQTLQGSAYPTAPRRVAQSFTFQEITAYFILN